MTDYILPFEKMQGLGNDFVMLHHKHIPENINLEKLTKVLCDRRFGVGADGVIIARPATEGEGDFGWDYINSDGSIGEMCGNGMRCYARYLFDRGIAREEQFSVETLAGVITPEIQSNGHVKVNMGQPILDAQLIPTSINTNEPVLQQSVTVLDREFKFSAVSMGNPHMIIWLNSQEELDSLDLEKYGQVLETSKYFPQKTNVEFVYHNPQTNNISFRVWERGAGITLACGTGACACVVSACLLNKIQKDQEITVHLPGGDLIISWHSTDNCVYMTGDARSVYLGQIEINGSDIK